MESRVVVRAQARYNRTNVRTTYEIEEERRNVVDGAQRHPDPGRSGYAHGRVDARILDPGLPAGGAEGQRAADAAEAARREADRLPRQRGPHRHSRSSLPAPLRLDVLRPQRGRWPALRLSRLEVRHRGQLPGPAQPPRGPALHRPGEGQG